MIWRTGEVALLGVEFGVVGGSITHAVEGADMEMIWLYQMLYPNINRNRVWQIGHAKQTMMETRGDKFVIGHEVSKEAPHWSLSFAKMPQKMPLIGGLCLVQWTSTTKGLNDLPLVGGLCLVQRTLTGRGLNDLPLIGGLCLVQQTSTTKGLNDLPLVRGLCLVQQTSTARGLNDLPLVGGLCLVQRTLTTKGLNKLPLIRGLCLIPMVDFDHDGSRDTNRSRKPRRTAVQMKHQENVLP